MKKLICIISLLCSLNCFGQAETKEELLNEVYQVFVGAKNGYYLYEKAAGIDIERYEMKYLKADFHKLIPDETIIDLIDNISKDSASSKWDFTKLVNTKEFNNDSTQITSLFNGVSIVKSDWSKDQIKAEEKRNQKKRERIGGLYYFSKPVFDRTHQFVIITMWYHCGILCGNGCLYLFKKVNGKWRKIGETNCSTS